MMTIGTNNYCKTQSFNS